MAGTSGVDHTFFKAPCYTALMVGAGRPATAGSARSATSVACGASDGSDVASRSKNILTKTV